MSDERPVVPFPDDQEARTVGPILSTWMAAVAPERAPERLLEESFARTMVSRQRRVFPWNGRPIARPAARNGRRLVLAALGAIVAVALGVGLLPGSPLTNGGPSPSPVVSPSPILSPRSGPSAAGPSLPPATKVEPVASIGVDAPMALASDGTTIWLFTANSDLLRIDPKTNSIAASAKLDLSTEAFQGIAGDDSSLWVTNWITHEVLRFDPRTLEPVTSIDTVAMSKGVLLTGGSLWVANTRGGSVERIDTSTNTIVATIPVGPAGPSGPNWLAQGLGSIWTTVPNIGSVVRISVATNAVEATIPINGSATPCGGLAAGPTAVWVSSCDGSDYVAQIDPATNTQVGEVDLGGRGYTFALVGDRAWISPEGGPLVRLDPATHLVDRAISPGAGFSGGGDIVVAAGSLWVIDGVAGRLLRLPLDAFRD
jgi:YVTN family beta-propeller protein